MGIYVYDERALAHLPAEGAVPVPRPRAATARRRRAGRRLPQRRRVVRHRHPGEHQRAVEAFEQLARGVRRMSDAELDRIRDGVPSARRCGRQPVSLGQPRLRLVHAGRRALAAAGASTTRESARRARACSTSAAAAATSSTVCRSTAPGEAHGIDLMDDRIAAGRERYPALQLAGRQRNRASLCRRRVRPRHAVHVPLVDPGRRRAPGRGARDAAGRRRLGALVRHARAAPARIAAGGGTPTVELDEQELRRLFGEPGAAAEGEPRLRAVATDGQARSVGEGTGGISTRCAATCSGLWRAA